MFILNAEKISGFQWKTIKRKDQKAQRSEHSRMYVHYMTRNPSDNYVPLEVQRTICFIQGSGEEQSSMAEAH